MRKVLNFLSFFQSSYIYRRTYGLRAGLRIALQVRRAHYVAAPGTLVRVDVPGLRSPLMLRARTPDTAVFQQIFGHRELEFDLAHHPSRIVDAGAHIGLSAIWLSQRFPGTSIVALEVEASNFSLLKMNTESYKEIIPMNKALWWKKTELAIQDPTVTNWEFRVTADSAGAADPVESVSVNEILREFNWNVIDFLKMDIEGAELEVFSHNSEAWIDQVGVIAVELHDRFRPGCADAVHRAIAGRDFCEKNCGEYRVFTRR